MRQARPARPTRPARPARPVRQPRRSLVLLIGAVLLAGCGSDDGETTDPDVEVGQAGETSDETAPDDDAADTAPDDEAPDGDADTADTDAGADDAGPTDGDADLVDIDVAQPGTWPVGDAGTVSFEVVDGSLALEDYEAADGWEATVDEEDSDEIEVDFVLDELRWEFEVEIDDGRLEVEIRQDHVDASAGSYDLPDDGSFAFEADGQLALTDISPGEGWEIVERDEESDEFEVDLRNGDRTVDVEVELDDGRIEVEIDYEVVGPLPS